MRWLKVKVETGPEAEDAAAELLRNAGSEGVWLEEGEAGIRLVYGFLPESKAGGLTALKERIGELPRVGLRTGSLRVTSEWVTDEDWAEGWKREYEPLSVGRRLLIKPAWLPDPPEAEGRLVVQLDPGMAFGTGYHPTTALCLEALDELVRPGCVVVDVGAGSGILAIAAAKLGAGRVVGVDVLAETVAVARENVRLNGVADRVTVVEGSVDEADALLGGARADLVVVNILARVIRRMAPRIAELLKPGGLFVFSGVIEHGAEDLTADVRSHGLDVTDLRYESEWARLVGRRRD